MYYDSWQVPDNKKMVRPEDLASQKAHRSTQFANSGGLCQQKTVTKKEKQLLYIAIDLKQHRGK